MQGYHAEHGQNDSVTSLIFPTYNPGPALAQTWQEVECFLRHAPGNWEVVFVCDGCTDGSPELLSEWARPYAQRVRILSYAPNRGKGYAVRHGLAAARGAWRLFTDVDLAYDLENVLRLAKVLWSGADVAIASRVHVDSRILLPASLQGYMYRRHLQSLVFATVARLLLPVKQWDTQAGLKGMSDRAAKLILPSLRCDGFGFDCELLTACARFELPVTEVPVHVRYETKESTTGLGTVGRMIQDLWRIRRTWSQTPTGPQRSADAKNRMAA